MDATPTKPPVPRWKRGERGQADVKRNQGDTVHGKDPKFLYQPHPSETPGIKNQCDRHCKVSGMDRIRQGQIDSRGILHLSWINYYNSDKINLISKQQQQLGDKMLGNMEAEHPNRKRKHTKG